MSTVDNKKHKRRKLKKNSKQDLSDQTVKNLSHLYNIQIEMPHSKPGDTVTINPTCDTTMTSDQTGVNNICRGSNPYLAGQQCLLCRCERTDPIRETQDADNQDIDANSLPQLPLWVCASCQKSMEDVEKLTKLDAASLSKTDSDDQEFTVESQALQMMTESRLSSVSETTVQSTPNTCHCTACSERRVIEADYQKETHELQKNWSELRRFIWRIYRESDPDSSPDPDDTEHPSDPDVIRELIHKLCRCDPHQLYRRLESQTREYILGKKVKLLRLLTTGQQTPMDTRTFIKKLLSVYHYLCVAASKLAVLFRELEEKHLIRFKVTWELHDKHMFQSIVYMDPLIQNSLQSLINNLRQGATNEEKGDDESYSSVLRQYIKFDNEMSVVCVVWRECHQYIEAYNDQQAALKVKQKMLKEDWEFFKQQRRLLEQVSKRSAISKAPQSSVPVSLSCTNGSSTPSNCTAGLEARFTETMRHILQGSKNPQEERQCPRCSQKSCPCDECTITHMITCGIISPETVENSSSHHMPPPFMHDSAQYIIDVTPPSMSSSGSSSSGSSSPVMVERLAPPFDDYADTFQSCEEVADDSQSGDDTTTDSKFADAETPQSPDVSDSPLAPDISADSPDRIPVVPASISVQNWVDASSKVDRGGSADVKACDCHHCITQSLSQSPAKANVQEQCQCHVCLQQRGSLASTALPHDMPSMTRPSEFHLYPHIHGHQVATADNQSLLHTHLYDLHVPPQQTQQQKNPAVSLGSKVPIKLDFDTPEGIQEHMYHAYSEWENTRMLLGAPHAYPSPQSNIVPDLGPVPAAAFTNEAFQSLSRDQNLLNKLTSLSNRVLPDLIRGTEDSDAALLYSPQPQPRIDSSSPQTCHSSTAANAARSAPQAPSSAKCMLDHSHGAATVAHSLATCGARPAPIGGNVSQQKINNISASMHEKSYCKHNGGMSASLPQPQHHNHLINNGVAPPPALNPSLKRPARQYPLAAAQANPNNSPSSTTAASQHTCSHMRNNAAGVSPSHAYGQNQCMNNGGAPPPSVLYPDIECNGHPDDDSLDDSCSEKSSSTSTSNQKDGKYCDCCYCEFFGHSNPPSVPTSKNYAEMRDRLRQRLKRKNELKDVGGGPVSGNKDAPDNNNADDVIIMNSTKYLGDRGLDELIQYINGLDDSKVKSVPAPVSTKAAKRARQKQRKAEKKKTPEGSTNREDELSCFILNKTRNEQLGDKERSNVSDEVDPGDSSDAKQRKGKTKKSQISENALCAMPNNNNVLTEEMKIVSEKNLKNNQMVKEAKIAEGNKKELRQDSKCDTAKSSTKVKSQNVVTPIQKSEVNSVDCEKIKDSVEGHGELEESIQKNVPGKVSVKQEMAVSKNVAAQLCQARKSSSLPAKGTDLESCRSHVGEGKKGDKGDISQQAKSDSRREVVPQSKSTAVPQTKPAVGDSKKIDTSSQQAKNMCKLEVQQNQQKANGKVEGWQQQQPKSSVKLEVSQHQQHQQHQQQQQPKSKVTVSKSAVNDSKQSDVSQAGKANEGKKVEKGKTNKEVTPVLSNSLPDLVPVKNDREKSVKTPQVANENGKVIKSSSLPNGIVIDSPKNARKKERKAVPSSNGSALHDKTKNEPSNVDSTKAESQKVEAPKVTKPEVAKAPVSRMNDSHLVNGQIPKVSQPVTSQCSKSQTPAMQPVGQRSVAGPTLKNGPAANAGNRGNTAKPAVDSAVSESVKSGVHLSPRSTEIIKAQNKNKRRNRKSKNPEDLSSVDEIFLPKTDSDLEGGDFDDLERELEEFKRFCFDCKPSAEDRVQVNVNLKDIFNKKKTGLGCS